MIRGVKSMSVNKVILVGRLGQNPEIKKTATGASVVNFSLATSDSYVDKAGQRQQRTEWHRIVAWERLAELCSQYLAKGRQVYIEGRIQSRQYQDKEGHTRTAVDIVAQAVQFLGSQPQQEGGDYTSYSSAPTSGSQESSMGFGGMPEPAVTPSYAATSYPSTSYPSTSYPSTGFSSSSTAYSSGGYSGLGQPPSTYSAQFGTQPPVSGLAKNPMLMESESLGAASGLVQSPLLDQSPFKKEEDMPF